MTRLVALVVKHIRHVIAGIRGDGRPVLPCVKVESEVNTTPALSSPYSARPSSEDTIENRHARQHKMSRSERILETKLESAK